MNIKIEKVLERDIDFLIINNIVNGNLLDVFLNEIELKDYKTLSVEHSYHDSDGESDLTIIADNGINKIGILIEDKINAPAMQNQAKRYDYRARTIKEHYNLFETYIFIIAPEKYLNENEE